MTNLWLNVKPKILASILSGVHVVGVAAPTLHVYRHSGTCTQFVVFNRQRLADRMVACGGCLLTRPLTSPEAMAPADQTDGPGSSTDHQNTHAGFMLGGPNQ